MVNKDLIVKAAANLKKAVPLMMKYQVPTTPLNYSLWYSYVSNDIPELNLTSSIRQVDFNSLGFYSGKYLSLKGDVEIDLKDFCLMINITNWIVLEGKNYYE